MNFKDIEPFKLFFKSVFDSITNTLVIAQDASDHYNQLQDDFDRRVVISEEYNGRQSQNVNISTTFGDDTGGLASKEFRFLYGSTLKYDRILPINHPDPSEVVNLQTLINAISTTPDVYLKKDGDSATGPYTFSKINDTDTIVFDNIPLYLNGTGGFTDFIPLTDNGIPNRKFVLDQIAGISIPAPGSQITIGTGSTETSGYALLGPDLAIAWVTGPSTYFTGTTNPQITLYTPITFDTIYSYSIANLNNESIGLISDNDAWWQVANAPSGNTFNLILQATDGSLNGYMVPKLMVIGKPVNTALTITTPDKVQMEADGQVYPMLVYASLTQSGGVAPFTWEILTSDYGAQFATGYTDILQISAPSIGVYNIPVKVTDVLGTIATKTIAITITAYTIVTLAIINADVSIEADAYPFSSIFTLNSSGGTLPITWAITSHTGTFTSGPTLSSGNIVTTSYPAAGSYSITVEATDSAGTPQVISKTINVTVSDYIPPPPDPCFESDETYILMSNGTGQLLKNMKAMDEILTISEDCLEKNLLVVTKATVIGITLKPTPQDYSIICQNIKSTQEHPWSTRNNPDGNIWIRSNKIIESTQLIEVFKDDYKYTSKITNAGITNKGIKIREAGNLSTTAKTFCVGPTINGPWFVVHNIWAGC